MVHRFEVASEWLGNRGSGTSDYRAYGREVRITSAGPEPIAGSAARVFHGDRDRWNPEQLLLAALSECHLLTYLYLAARNGIVVVAYTDDAECTVETEGDGGRVTDALLRPAVTIAGGDPTVALDLHGSARQKCFIAASVAFSVRHEPRILLADDPAGL